MNFRSLQLMLALFLLAVAVWVSSVLAGTPLGTIASLGPVKLSGSQISPSAVSSWPVVSGDEIVTTTSLALIRLQDRSTITLNRNSQAKLVNVGGRTRLQLSQGSASYKLSSGSQLQIYALDRLVTPQFGQAGTVSIQSGSVSAGSLASSSALTNRTVAAAKHKPKHKPKPKSKKKDDRDHDDDEDKDNN
jgi:hypothetical protein